MNKKDRIAVVVSLFITLPCLAGATVDGIMLIPVLPVLIYWAYRFIKGDISFLGSVIKED